MPGSERRKGPPAQGPKVPLSPSRQLEGFLGRYAPEVRALARTALGRLRRLLPGAVQLVYDNYNALAIGFGPTERASQAIVSLALYPRWVSLFFLNGVVLDDPNRLLKGSGNRVRHVVLKSASQLDEPAILALLREALERAGTPIDPKGRGRIVVKSVSKRQRPRRPGARNQGKTARAVLDSRKG